MRIPHKVEIKPGIVYYVTYVDRFDDPYQSGYCIGSDFKNGYRTIQIKKGLTPTFRAKTFLHELLHAIDFEWNVKIPHKLIEALEKPLFILFTRNPSAFTAAFSLAAKKRKAKKKKKGVTPSSKH